MEENKKMLSDERIHKDIRSRKIKEKSKKIKLGKYLKKTANKIKEKISKINSGIKTKNKNTTQINKRPRDPGIDLFRLISMYFVVLNHFLSHGGGFRKYNQYKRQLILLHSFTAWHNDGFALISGIVGYKTNKYSNLLYLWITVFFYSVGIHIYITKYKHFRVRENINVEFYPIIFERYWYFSEYFGMYLFLPVINKGIESLNKNELKLVVMSILGIFVIWRDYKNPKKDIFRLKYGYSVLWLLSLYLTGAYIGKYHVIYSGLKKYIYCFICLFIYSFFSYTYYKVYFDELYLGDGYYQKELVSLLKNMLNERFDALLFVVQSITVCLVFMQLNYNKYFAKIICFLGPLAFGIYLIHIHPLMLTHILAHIYDRDPRNLSLKKTMILVFTKPLKIVCLCMAIDYCRHLLFTFLRLRKIFIFLEQNLVKLMNYI